MPYNGGELVAEVFKQEGVKYVFGIAGGHIYPMMEACEERCIRYIGVRHEMNAAFMAEGWSLVTGLANSERGSFPVFCLAGKARIAEYDRNELQDFNQIDMIKHITKYARTVIEAERIPEYVGRAMAYCTTGRPGPVYLEIPRDLMEGNVSASKVEIQKKYRNANPPMGNQTDIGSALKLLKESKRPVVIAGGGVWWSQSQKELTHFIEKWGIPLFTRSAARGAVPDSHDLCMGIAMSRNPIFRSVVAEADVALVIGTRTGFTMTRDSFPRSLKIIRIDIDPVELTNQLDVNVAINGDANCVLKQLNQYINVDQSRYSEWVNHIKEIKKSISAATIPATISDQFPIHPMRLVHEVGKRVDQNTVVVIDGGDTSFWGSMGLPATGPGQMLGITGTSFGALGVGVPYAIAAKLAHPDKKVILLTGDGAFGYGVMEYDTAHRYGIPFTTVILNDKCWGMIKRSEAKKSSPDKQFVGLDLAETRYDLIVAALGGYGEYVTLPKEIGPAIDRAIASGKPACVNVMTDTNIGPA